MVFPRPMCYRVAFCWFLATLCLFAADRPAPAADNQSPGGTGMLPVLQVVHWRDANATQLTHWRNASGTQPTPAKRLNVLLIVTDDQRPDTIHALGNPVIHTPNLDSLVRQGTAFTGAIAPNPICTPSRAEIMTGCSGMYTGNRLRGKHTPVLWAQTMHDVGYKSWYVGKWMNDGRPITRGYDESQGLFAGGGARWWVDTVDHHGRPVTGYRGWIFQTDDGKKLPERGVGLTPNISKHFADAAISFINRKPEAPFFLHVNFTAPHDPLLMPPGYERKYDPKKIPLPPNFLPEHPFDHGNARGRDEVLLPFPRTSKDVREDLAVYYAVISHMDEHLGRILAALEATGQAADTLVIFTSDQGLAMGSHGLRGKQNMYDHTVGSPLIFRGPGIPKGRRSGAQCYLRDLYPTVCDLAGIKIPETVQGRSLAPVLRGEVRSVRPHVFGHYGNFQRMIRTERWKLIHYPKIEKYQLFDLPADPHELNDLAADPQHADVLDELRAELEAWQRDMNDPAAPKSLSDPQPFRSNWPVAIERTWVGPEYWSNRLQDWRISAGRLECITSGPNRNVALLTRQLGPEQGTLKMTVRLGRLGRGNGWAGFRIGTKGRLSEEPTLRDWRDDAVRGRGLNAGLTTDGRLFIGAPQGGGQKTRPPKALPTDDVVLSLTAEPSGENYKLTLAANKPGTGEELGKVVRNGVPGRQLVGGLALVCDARLAAGKKARRARAGGDCRFWFRDWTVSGDKLVGSDDQAFGPILWGQYTLSQDILKITAQMPPIGEKDTQVVRLEIRDGNAWKQVGRAKIDPLARTATVRVENWDSAKDVPYRLVYALVGLDGTPKDHYWTGTVRHDPIEKDVIKVAGFTGNADPAWPNVDLVKTLKAVDPDVLFFSGDNIYEPVAGYGVERSPLDRACLDYLRKWYFFGWAYRDLLRDRPCVSIPDDHDVYQGNLWGHGGRKTDENNKGGYSMPAEWVKMVERTQTSNLPDPFDPTPVEQGIGVYYCPMTYGRISFAVIEDRKFKTGCEGLVPPTEGRSDHVTDPNFDPKTADVPEARLLGDRQLKFLRAWAADWRGADFKMVLSQTVFAGAATHHGGDLKYLVVDYDSNGWPQTGRNKALDAIRRGFAFHMAGDQHLATMIHHGIDDWDDACWSLAVPSVANYYLRAWKPKRPGIPLAQGMPDYTGRYFDGLGNRISVWAATNPGPVGKEPAWLHDRKPGFGLIKLNKKTDQITIECWPRHADPTNPKAKQYAGWPKTIQKLDNYARQAKAYLPTIQVTGMTNPVVQIIEEPSGQIVYTVRILGTTFRPKVFREGSYTVKVGRQPDKMKTFRNVKALPPEKSETLVVELEP